MENFPYRVKRFVFFLFSWHKTATLCSVGIKTFVYNIVVSIEGICMGSIMYVDIKV